MNKGKLHTTKTTGFKTPNGYFDSLEGSILSKVNSPLAKIDESGHSVPEKYLDSIEDIILNRIDSESGKVVNLFSRRNIMYISGVAAAVVLLFSVFIKDNVDLTLNSEMVENYLVEQDLTSYELASLLNETDFLDEDFTIVEEQLDESELETYLLNNVNIEDIIEQ